MSRRAALAARWAPPLLWMGLIFFLSSRRLPASVATAPDWLLHGIAYGALAVLLHRAVVGRLRPARISAGTLAGVLLATVLYGVSDEVHQSFIPGRTAEARDVLADAVGAAVALAAVAVAAERKADPAGALDSRS